MGQRFLMVFQFKFIFSVLFNLTAFYVIPESFYRESQNMDSRLQPKADPPLAEKQACRNDKI